MVDIKDLDKKGYHFELESIDDLDPNVPVAKVPESYKLHFNPDELLALRKFYKEHGRDELFITFFDEYPEYADDNIEALTEYLYDSTVTLAKESELQNEREKLIDEFKKGKRTHDDTVNLMENMEHILPYDLSDYEIIPPDELIDDVLNDDYTDWKKIQDDLDEMDRQAE